MGRPLGFSTLGCPDATVHEVAALARRHDCAHVELRAHPDGPIHVGMSATERALWTAGLADAGVRPVDVASYVALAETSMDTRAVVESGRAHVALAEDLGASGLRVFGGGPGDPDTAERARERLSALLDATGDSEVGIWLETHDRLPRGADAAAVLDGMPPRAAAIWDVAHPWHHGEEPRDTVRQLADRLALVQVKDVRSREDVRPVLPGSGAIPLHAVVAALSAHDWDGPLSLEWERAWFPDLPDLDAALPAARAWLASPGRHA